MKPFLVLDDVAVPLDQSNVDTGLICPARFLRSPRKKGFQDFLFRDIRFDKDGVEDAGFVLNREPFRNARILVGDRNFGIGSAREQAAWALTDYGIRCVIAADFGEIFHLNSFKSGLLLVQLEQHICSRLREQLHTIPGSTLLVDLPQQTVTGPDGVVYCFDIDSFQKRCLLDGLDDIGVTLQHDAAIQLFEQSYRKRFDWLFDFKG